MGEAAGVTAYLEVVVDVGDDAAEALTNFLWEQGAVGVVEEALLAGPSRLRAFFPVTASGDALALTVRVDAYVAGLRALDLGTGSGILAIAAARLGVADVLACDSDPDAIAAAGANAERNGVSDRVRAVVDDVATLAAPPAPLVLANLLAAAHRAFGARYTALVADGGVLVAGGLLDAEADDVAAALAAYGFRREAARSLEGWTSLALRHAALHASA